MQMLSSPKKMLDATAKSWNCVLPRLTKMEVLCTACLSEALISSRNFF